MKLFLSSAVNALSLIGTILPNKGKNAKIIFIENASDNYSVDKWWVREDKEVFEKMGCELIFIDLRTISVADLSKQLDSSDVIHFSGGSVLYLISLIKKMNLREVLVKAVKSGKIIYSGTSAGSMITSKDLSLSSYDDEDTELLKGMDEFSGLGLVDFFIIPHTNNKDFLKSDIQMIENLRNHLQPLIFIDDSKAVLVDGDKFKILTI